MGTSKRQEVGEESIGAPRLWCVDHYTELACRLASGDRIKLGLGILDTVNNSPEFKLACTNLTEEEMKLALEKMSPLCCWLGNALDDVYQQYAPTEGAA